MRTNVLKDIFDALCRLSPKIKRTLWMTWYDYLVKMDRDAELLFMNYGYAGLNEETPKLPLHLSNEKYRYCIQLYHYVAQGVDIKGKKVLEVGCGRGGGAAYVAKQFAPAVLKGLDFSRNAIDFCTKYHTLENLSFLFGDAETLPFDDQSVDVVLNVESLHSYGTPERFFNEVYRVLRPKGYFLLADFRDQDVIPLLHDQLRNADLTLLKEELITPNVVRALELDHERKLRLIRQRVPGILYTSFLAFAATKNSKTYKTFKSRATEYLNLILQKVE